MTTDEDQIATSAEAGRILHRIAEDVHSGAIMCRMSGLASDTADHLHELAEELEKLSDDLTGHRGDAVHAPTEDTWEALALTVRAVEGG